MSTEKVIQIMEAGLLSAKKVCLSISGYSMYPLLQPGSKIMISTNLYPDRILIGDIVIITSRNYTGIVAHRVICIRRRKGKPVLFITKGDANRSFDRAIGPDQILGKIVTISKENKSIHLSRSYWRAAGVLIAVSSGICGLVHQCIDTCLCIDRCNFSCGLARTKISLWAHRLTSHAHRIFLRAIILPLQ
ncbi:MAG: signal peptidase I [bacterium]